MGNVVRLFGALVCAGALSCAADVVTNVWTNPKGGNWFAASAEDSTYFVNWADGQNCISTNVGLFQLEGGKTVAIQKEEKAYAGGLVFKPLDPPEGEDLCTTNTWYLRTFSNGAFYTRATTLGYIPLRVEDGTLVLADTCRMEAWADGDRGPLRKEGNGTVRVSDLYRAGAARREFQIAEGRVIPMLTDALGYTDVRVTDPAGALVLTNFSTRIAMGSFQTATGAPVDLAGNELLLGLTGTDYLSDAFTGTGGVTAVGKNLVVTNVQPNIVYGASVGRLRLDSQTGEAVPFVAYDFEESLTKDSSGHNRDLVAEGAVSLVDDAVRGGKVARFDGTANSGGKLIATVTGTDELTGNSDYTVSLWAKTAKVPPLANNWPTLVAIGTEQKDHQIMQFRFWDAACSHLLLGHWNGNGDFTNLPTTVHLENWHHYVVVREGGFLTFWCDGVRVWAKADCKLEMAFPETVQISLGWLPGSTDRYFCGDIDNVRIYSRAVGRAGVERLYAGLNPPTDGPLPAAGDPVALPANAKFRTAFNGEIQLAGEQTVAVSNIVSAAPRGAFTLPGGGKLTLAGSGTYPGVVSGTGAFAKDGAGELKVTGLLDQTGGTEVKGGRLVVQAPALQPEAFAIYDFEDETMIGREANGTGRNLTDVADVTRVWDAERQSWVARFPGTKTEKLSQTITTPVLSGNTDYTVSVWAKPAADCPDAGSFVSLGTQANFQEIVFRYHNSVDNGNLVLTHWGTTVDFVSIPTGAKPQGRWHHFVATRKGTSYAVYYDGALMWTTNKAQNLSIPEAKLVTIGRQVNRNDDRFFKGDIDDVRIYTRALGAADVARLHARRDPAAVVASGTVPDAAAALPAPVLHYAFEDAKQPGRDSAAGANHLSKVGGGTFKLVDSPLGGKALKFDNYGQVYLKSANFPSAIPANGKAYTVSLWVQTGSSDAMEQVDKSSSHYPTFLCWGNPTAKTIGYMLSYHHDPGPNGWVYRNYVRGTGNSAKDFCYPRLFGLSRDGNPELRWHHFVSVYDPNWGVKNYVDGQYVAAASDTAKFTSDNIADGSFLYLGAKSTALTAPFRGALDEVKVFAAALNAQQVVSLMHSDMSGARVLPKDGAVSVAEDAALEINGTDERVSSLTGAGTVDLVRGRVTLAGASSFDGSLTGAGTIALPEGASLTLGANPTGFTGYVDLMGGTLNLPAGVEKIPATFRVTPIGTAATTACPGDVEIPDGAALAPTTAFAGPFVTAAGKVFVLGGGTVTLPTAKTTGTWTIASGAEVVDRGTGDLNARWTVANADPNRKVKFAIQDNAFTCRVYAPSTMLLFR